LILYNRDVALLFCAAIFVSGCSSQLRYPAIPQTGIARAPDIALNSATGTASMEITVLIYNVAGLPWPFGCGKASRDTDESGERIPITCRSKKRTSKA